MKTSVTLVLLSLVWVVSAGCRCTPTPVDPRPSGGAAGTGGLGGTGASAGTGATSGTGGTGGLGGTAGTGGGGGGDLDACARACGRLSDLKCAEAEPTPDGATCTEVCRNTETSVAVSLDPDCVATLGRCEDIDRCAQNE